MECMQSTAKAFDPDHPLLRDRPRLERILDAMFIAIQRQLSLPASRRRNEKGPEPALLGGVSARDVLQEAFEELLLHPHDGFTGSWEALGVDIAKKRAIDAWRKSRTGLQETEHRPALTVISGDSEVTGGDGRSVGAVIAAVPDTDPTPEEQYLGDLHRWMRQIGHDGRLFKSASDPVEVHSMAQRLSSEERVRVDEMARAGVDVDEMARRLGRHRSTVHRELKRCGGRCGYDAEAAQAAADLRARRPKTPKLAGDPVLAAAVGGLLADRMSPHAISAQLRSEGHGICAETVYAACYDHSGARGLPEGSWKLLPRRCRKRRPRGRHARKPSPLGDFKAISQRPASVEDRRQPGHWEGDLIIGKANRSAVATLVERTSRQTLTVALPHGYDAHNTAAAVTAALARQPRHLVKTLTWDQGREMARWPDIEATLGIEVYFCDPHSPWQRPTNEQTNGLLRRWLPKSTDLNVGAVRLAIIEDHLNTMPRKLHDWDSAHSVYAALCRNHR